MLRLYNPRPPEPVVNWTWTIGILSAHGLALLALVCLAMINPKIPVWLSEAAEAQLGMSMAPTIAPQTQIAQPSAPTRPTQVVQQFYK
jgi:hypothetical protein